MSIPITPGIPRVVGTIITSDFLREWSASPRALPCEIVELRVDGFSEFPEWMRIGTRLEETGLPVIATVRLAREGGRWRAADADRWPLFEAATEVLSGVDIELNSDLAERICSRCRDRATTCVVSFHDFEKTPAMSELRRILDRAGALGASIAKIAAMTHSSEDVERLRSLLHERWPMPICVIGMGPLARETRRAFPLEGSCLAYGFLDQAGAPGQYSAAELKEFLESARRP